MTAESSVSKNLFVTNIQMADVNALAIGRALDMQGEHLRTEDALLALSIVAVSVILCGMNPEQQFDAVDAFHIQTRDLLDAMLHPVNKLQAAGGVQ